MILTFAKKYQGQILIDQKRSEILEESMRCSFLVKFGGFSFQLYYQRNFFTGIVLVFFVLLFYSGKYFLAAVPFYVNSETRILPRKPLKYKAKFTVLLQIIYLSVLEKNRDFPREDKRGVPVLFLSLFQKYIYFKKLVHKILKTINICP